MMNNSYSNCDYYQESLNGLKQLCKSDWLNAVCFAFYGQVHEIERFIEAIQK